MGILYQGFQIQKELDYITYIWRLFVVIMDGISIISNIRLLYIHKRLCEIFGCPESQPFADLSITVVGDMLQLPPIKSPQIFEKCNSTFGDSFNFWSLFLIAQH